jgi:hypothetical protein
MEDRRYLQKREYFWMGVQDNAESFSFIEIKQHCLVRDLWLPRQWCRLFHVPGRKW